MLSSQEEYGHSNYWPRPLGSAGHLGTGLRPNNNFLILIFLSQKKKIEYNNIEYNKIEYNIIIIF